MSTLGNRQQGAVGLSFVIGVILGAIFGFLIFWTFTSEPKPTKEVEEQVSAYEEVSKLITDSIEVKEGEIQLLNERLNKLDAENLSLRQQLENLKRKKNEVDNAIVSGSLDDNVLFLSEYLSEKTSLSE